MWQNISYLGFLVCQSLSLLLIPDQFIKNYETGIPQSIINIYLSQFLQNEIGLRICGLFYLLLLFAFILKQDILKLICVAIYGGFIILLLLGLFFDNQGQQQSEKLERFGFQVAIFSFILYNNQLTKQSESDKKKVNEVIKKDIPKKEEPQQTQNDTKQNKKQNRKNKHE